MKKIFALLIVLLFALTNVNAVINTYYPYYPKVSSVELRSDYDSYWSNSITAKDGDSIDISAQVFVSYDYDNYPYYEQVYVPYDEVQVWAEIYGNGIYLKRTSTKTYNISQLTSREVEWSNAFFADDSYSNYRVVVHARSAFDYSNESQSSAFINEVIQGKNSYCSDIEIYNNSVAMNENETDYVTFNIKNNSDERFYIKGVSPVDYEQFFGVFSYTNDSSVSAGSTGQVKLKVVSSEVNADRTGTATLRIKGEFSSGKSCSYSDIEKNFLVKIYNDSSDLSCREINIIASDERMQENDSEIFSFNLRNYSDTGFYVDRFDAYSSSSYFTTVEEYKPSYIPENSDREFTYRVSSNNVSSDRTEQIRLRVSGHYSGGDSCSYSEIGEEVIDLTIEDGYSNGSGDCEDLTLITRTLNLNEDNTITDSFSIENNSNTKFYVQDLSLEENSSYLDFSNYSGNFTVYANSNKTINFTANTENVSSDKTITSYFEVKGEFENGKTCSFSDTRKSFTVKINEDSYSDAYCNEINVLTKTVSLNNGETKNFDFEIENNSNKRFYIDYVKIYDNDSGIYSKEYNSPSSISANNSGKITVNITASQSGSATAFIEVTGHYENGRSCNASDIGRKSFLVKVGSSDSSLSCSDFKLDAPSTKSILGQEEITLNIDNPTTKKGTIRLSGTNLSVSPYSIEIPANYSATKRIQVELLEGTESFLVYNVSLDGCNISSKTTKITSAINSFEVVDYPREKTIGLNDTISFTIKNNSGTSREFKISMNAPANWKVNEKSVVIPGNSDRTISLSIEADKTGIYNTVLMAESAGKTIEKEIELTVTGSQGIIVSAETRNGAINELELIATIDNQTNEKIQGNLIIELPENWTLEGTPSVSVEPKTKKEFSIKLKTDGKNLEQEIPVSLELDNGQKIDSTAEFKTSGLGTAFASLAENVPAVIGLLIIVIIVVVLLTRK